MSNEPIKLDAFLSHAHADAAWVEDMAGRLGDECGFNVWLDKWVLVPGKSWQQAMARGLEEASCCVVFLGARTPEGWCQQETERALDRQVRDQDFRFIPVLLPDASADPEPSFVGLRTWADFREGQDEEYAFHVLRQGILGKPIGRWKKAENVDVAGAYSTCEEKLLELRRLRGMVHEEVAIEFERRILDRWLDEGADE